MVKERISATVDSKTVKLIDKILSQGNYRNKSHVIEEAIEFLSDYEIKKLRLDIKDVRKGGRK